MPGNLTAWNSENKEIVRRQWSGTFWISTPDANFLKKIINCVSNFWLHDSNSTTTAKIYGSLELKNLSDFEMTLNYRISETLKLRYTKTLL